MSDLALAQTMHRERMALAQVPRQRSRRLGLWRRLSPVLAPRAAVSAIALSPEAALDGLAAGPVIRPHGVVLDCSDAAVLAEFYQGLLGGEIRPHGESDADLEVAGQLLSFHGIADYEHPRWPEGHPESLRLDFAVTDFESPHSLVTALGGLPLAPVGPPESGDDVECRVYADPAGHAFSLCRV